MKTTAIAVALMLATGNVPAQPTEAPFLEASSTFQQAREAWMPWSKMKYSEQGLDHIDRALDEVQRHPSLAAAPEPFRNAVKRTAAQAAGGGK